MKLLSNKFTPEERSVKEIAIFTDFGLHIYIWHTSEDVLGNKLYIIERVTC